MGTGDPGSDQRRGKGERGGETAGQPSLVTAEVDGIPLIPKAPEAGSGSCNAAPGKAILFCNTCFGGWHGAVLQLAGKNVTNTQ